jgi:hypothetical protein
MRYKTILGLVAVGALSSAVACGGASRTATNGTPGGTATPPAAPNSNSAPNPSKPSDGAAGKAGATVVKTESGPDNSTITVKKLEGGATVEVRTWEAGPVEKVTRQPNLKKKTIVRVKMRDGARYRVDDAATVEHALDWTGEQLADAAKRLGTPMSPKEAPGADDGDDAEGAGPKTPAATNTKAPG